MTSTVEVATLPSADTPQTSIHVRNESSQYVFGRVAEGTQRAFTTHGIPIAPQGIFLSGSVEWDQVGGLIGFILSSATAFAAEREARIEKLEKKNKKGREMVVPTAQMKLEVHAGDNISHILGASRGFVFRQPISIRLHEHRQDPRAADPSRLDPDWQDDNLKVWKVPTRRDYSSSPLKRSRESSEEVGGKGQDSEPQFKEAPALSDPEVAKFFAEQVLFSLDPTHSAVLLQTTAGQLGKNDFAFTKNNGVFHRFDASSATPSNPNREVWVYPNTKEWKAQEKHLPRVFLSNIDIPKTTYSQISMSYIVKNMDRRGKFDRSAADALGVKVKDFRLLTSGQPAPGKDGQTVTPDMVLGDTLPGKGFIIADIASRDFLDSFMDRPEWNNPELMANIEVMYWLLGPNLESDPQITGFMKERPNIRHVLCAPETSPNVITIPGSAELQMQLHHIDPERFAIPDYNNRTKADAPAPDSHISFGRTGHKTKLMPKVTFDESPVTPFVDLVKASQAVGAEVVELAEKAKSKAEDPAFLSRIEEMEKDIPSRDAEILCLGTGSSCPSKYRNVSGTLIRVPQIGSYLLDGGEGTLGQLRRIGGEQQTIDILRDLKCLVVSHLHADHHLGVPSLLKAWYEQTLRDGRNSKLAVSCNGRYRLVLEELSQVEDFGFHRLYFPSCGSDNSPDRPSATEAQFEGNDCGLKRIKRIPVPHCYRSMATELEFSSGLRIAYSGDTPPTSQFAQVCKGVHLLIHECTFDDGMEEHASVKGHSTMAQALGVAREMKARRTLLTHFSQRYTKARAIKSQSESESGEQDVLMAFDFMRIKLGDFQKAACYTPAIQTHLESLAS